MNVLLLGSGGREHALAWKIAQSPELTQLWVAPGNAGTAQIATNLDLNISDFAAIEVAILKEDIHLVVIGPEQPLVDGLYDFITQSPKLKQVKVLGPNQKGATLEGSKAFSKAFMMKYNIPTAKYATFNANNLEDGYSFLATLNPPYVLKADGLAAGKGVLIIDDLEEAKRELSNMIQHQKFGLASAQVVIEEFLQGIELSVFALVSGDRYIILPEAKDYKRIGEGDTGLNTGGMGAVSPVPFITPLFRQKVEHEIIKPTVEGLKQEGVDYRGFIFFGLMNSNGQPKVIEYNVRMGDPETEVVIPRIEDDILPILYSAASGTLSENLKLKVIKDYCLTVIQVAGGYPEAYAKGDTIDLKDSQNGLIFHAGTKQSNHQIVTNGGRVLAVTALGQSIAECRTKAYQLSNSVTFHQKYQRTDIGLDLLPFE